MTNNLEEALPQVKRPARSIIGWLTLDQAQSIQSGFMKKDTPNPEYEEIYIRLKESVEKRTPGVDQINLIQELPEELNDHVERLRATQEAKIFFDQGWQVKIAELNRVIGIQAHIFIDQAEERTANLNQENYQGLIETTLPIPSQTKLPIQFDSTKNAWIIGAQNPNLRILGNFKGEFNGFPGFGFLIQIAPSFMQVAKFNNKFILRDGYHRSFGLLKKGISKVPVFYKEFTPMEDLGLPAGMLSPGIYLGDRPPILTDYLNDQVSIEIGLPATQKMIIIQGLELSHLG